MSVTNVRKPLFGNHYSLYMSEPMQGKTLMNIVNVKKSFSGKFWLLVYQRMETREKPYDCNDVKKPSLENISSLYIRGLIQGRNPIDAVSVEKTFSQKSILSAHQRTHTRQKPYKCSSLYIRELMKMRNLPVNYM